MLRARIRELEKQLKAETVIQEEEGHESEPHGPHGYSGIGEDNYAEHTDWIIDKPRIANPDFEKRDFAKLELLRIYRSLKWYQIFLKNRIEEDLGLTS